jgi:hypothetical protein
LLVKCTTSSATHNYTAVVTPLPSHYRLHTRYTLYTHKHTRASPSTACIHTLDDCTHATNPTSHTSPPHLCVHLPTKSRPGHMPFCYTWTRKATAATPHHTPTYAGRQKSVCEPRYRCTGRPSLGRLCKDTRLTSCLPAHVTMIRDNHPAPSLPPHLNTPTPAPHHTQPTRAWQGSSPPQPRPSLTHAPIHTTHKRGSTEASCRLRITHTQRGRRQGTT